MYWSERVLGRCSCPWGRRSSSAGRFYLVFVFPARVVSGRCADGEGGRYHGSSSHGYLGGQYIRGYGYGPGYRHVSAHHGNGCGRVSVVRQLVFCFGGVFFIPFFCYLRGRFPASGTGRGGYSPIVGAYGVLLRLGSGGPPRGQRRYLRPSGVRSSRCHLFLVRLLRSGTLASKRYRYVRHGPCPRRRGLSG